jgi:hypothetical protein
MRTDELALGPGEVTVRGQRILYVVSACLESRQEIAVAVLEILQDLGQLAARCLWIKLQDSIHDVVCPLLVHGAELARLRGGPEGAHHYPRRVGAQGEILTRQERAW